MRKLNIAIVDDCPADIFNLKTELIESGEINVELVAMNGADFINKLDKNKPILDIVLLDLKMPVLNGIDTIKILNKRKIDFKILVISHAFYSAALQELQENGVIHYCRKNVASIQAILPSVMIGENAYRDRELSKRWEELSSNSSLKNKDESYWRDSLSPTDLKIIKLIAKGLNAKAIADILGYESSSIEKYRTNILRTIGLNNVAHLVAWGFTHGLIIGSDIFSEHVGPESLKSAF